MGDTMMDIDSDVPPPQERPLRHKTLSAYYLHLVKLETYLGDVDGLVYHSDSDAYRELVSTAVCAPRLLAPVPPFEALAGSHAAAVDSIVDELRGRGDVLAKAVKNAELGHHTQPRSCLDAGCTSTVLLGSAWQQLRSRIGEAAFRHLFISTSIFVALGNNCYMQLCGPPVYDVYDSTKRSGRRESEDDKVPNRVPKRGGGAASVNLSRHRLYYGRPSRTASGSLRYGLPKKHILNTAVPDDDPKSDVSLKATIEVLLNVFPSMRSPKGPVSGGSASPWDRVKGNRRRLEQMLPILHKILLRHRSLNYRAMLNRCLQRLDDVDLDAYPNLTTESKQRMSWVSGKHELPAVSTLVAPLRPVSHSQVCRFVVDVLRSLLPAAALGSGDNFSVLLSRTRNLVQARMHEPVNVHSLVQGLHINEFTWFAVGDGRRVPPQEALKRRQLVEQFMYWLFEHFIIPLLRASFYATETASTRYETVYYSHEAWGRATGPHLHKLQAELLEELDETQHHLAKGPLGASGVRLIPKPNGFRPIVNLGRTTGSKSDVRSQKGPSANSVLRGVHQVLTFEKNRKRASLPSCLFGTNEVFAPLRDLKQELIRQHGKVPKLYFAKMDIKAAFDTIKQDKVIEVVEHMLDKNHDYYLMLYCILLPPASKASQASARRLFKTRATLADRNLTRSEKHAQDLAQPMRNAVVVDLYRRQEITRRECIELLRKHIQQNVWQIGDQYFRQKTGIPQGSKISSLLCSFFYAFMEAEHLSWTQRPGTRLLRYIDDFLLVTDDFGVARRFVDRMTGGFPEYGAHVVPSKTLLSFEFAPRGQAASVVPVAASGGAYFPYCGFLIDTLTLDFGVDLDRLIAGPTRQSFALRTNRRRGGTFVGWLSRQLENRNHAAYLDTNHNTVDTVYMNVFINFAHTALKIPYYFAGTDLDARRSQLVYGWLCLAAEYTYSAGRARVRHAARGSAKEHFAVSRKAFFYIAKAAMFCALSQRASRIPRVVHLLRINLDSREHRGVAERLGSVVDRGWEMMTSRKA